MKRIALCLGLFAAPASAQTLNCELAETQTQMTQCAQMEWKAADAALNRAYTGVIEEMRRIDADLPKADRGAEAALRRSQRAWITVRDETCLARGYLLRGGSAEPMLVASCQAGMTLARTDEILMLTRLD